MKKVLTLTTLMVLVFTASGIDKVLADEAKNEAIIERNLREIWNEGNFAMIDEIISTHYVRHMPGGIEYRGRDGYKEHVLSYRTPLPDIFINMDIMISEGDYVVVRYSWTGTHSGEGIGAPTGKNLSGTSMLIHRLAGGKMVECWLESDSLSFMQKLGYKLVPPE